jgi:HK97 family phage portal protein
MKLTKRVLRSLIGYAFEEDKGAGAQDKEVVAPTGKTWDDFFLRAIKQNRDSVPKGKEYKTSSTVYLALNKISNNIASVPFVFYKGDQQVFDTPMDKLFDRPNPLMSRFQLFESTIIHMGLHGEAFWLLNESIGMVNGRPGSIPAEIYVLNPKEMKHVVDDGQLVGWVYQNTLPLELNQVVHFKLYNPYDPYRGLAPLEAARIALDTDYEASRYNKSFYENDATPSLVVSIPGEEPLPNDEFLRLKTQFENRHRGSANARRVAFAQAGMTITPLTVTQDEMKYIESRTFSRDEILATFGVPKSVAGYTEGLNRATAFAQKRSFWIETLLPYMTLIQEQLNHSLFSQYTPELTGKFDRDSIEELRADLEKRAKVAREYFGLGIPFTEINDRLNLGYEPTWEGADIGFVPLNFTTMDNALKAVPDPKNVGQAVEGSIANLPEEVPKTIGHKPSVRISELGEKAIAKLERFIIEQRTKVMKSFGNGHDMDWVNEDNKLIKLMTPIFDEMYPDETDWKEKRLSNILKINENMREQVEFASNEDDLKTIYKRAFKRIKFLAQIEYLLSVARDI